MNGRLSAGKQGQPIEISGEPFRSIAVTHFSYPYAAPGNNGRAPPFEGRRTGPRRSLLEEPPARAPDHGEDAYGDNHSAFVARLAEPSPSTTYAKASARVSPNFHTTLGPTATTRPDSAIYDLNCIDHIPNGTNRDP